MPIAPHADETIHASLWWAEAMGRLPAQARPLAVILPRADNPPELHRALGSALQAWMERTHGVPHIWGLQDLIQGQVPRSPCEYFLISRSVADLDNGFEPAALVMVTSHADADAVGESLVLALKTVKSSLSSVSDLDNYCFQRR